MSLPATPRTRPWQRPLGRYAARLGLLLLLAALATPAVSRASWILPSTDGYDLQPNPPTVDRPTTFILYGTFPFTCGVVANASVNGAGDVALTLRQESGCPGDSLRHWSQAFVLGNLPIGNHTIHITMTVERPDSGTHIEQGDFTFGVEDTSVVLPPPPPPHLAPAFLFYSIDPPNPDKNSSVTLTAHGRYPFACPGEIASQFIDASHLAITLTEVETFAACAGTDTLRAWDQAFTLGVFPPGTHTGTLAIAIVSTDSTRFETHGYGFVVADPDAPPPPPPGDSLQSVMSPARPNPFTEESRFSVSLDQSTRADVSVYDLGGRRVRTVFRGFLPRGTSELRWDGRREDGSAAGGIYFYRLVLPDRVVSHRVVLLARP